MVSCFTEPPVEGGCTVRLRRYWVFRHRPKRGRVDGPREPVSSTGFFPIGVSKSNICTLALEIQHILAHLIRVMSTLRRLRSGSITCSDELDRVRFRLRSHFVITTKVPHRSDLLVRSHTPSQSWNHTLYNCGKSILRGRLFPIP